MTPLCAPVLIHSTIQRGTDPSGKLKQISQFKQCQVWFLSTFQISEFSTIPGLSFPSLSRLQFIYDKSFFLQALVNIQANSSFSGVQFTWRQILLSPGSSLHIDKYFFLQGLVYVQISPSLSRVQFTYRQILSPGSSLRTVKYFSLQGLIQVLLSSGSSLHISFFLQSLVYVETSPSRSRVQLHIDKSFFLRGLVYITTNPSFSGVQFTYRQILLSPGSSLHIDKSFSLQGLVYI